MRLRRCIAALIVLGSASLPMARAASAAGGTLSFPSSVTFPEVTLPVFDVGPRQSITLRNDTAATVRIGIPNVQGPNAALFTLVANYKVLQLNPGNSASFVVEFFPYVGGTYSAELAFTADGVDRRVALTGTARSTAVLPANLAGYRFVPVSPVRVLDSRSGTGFAGAVPSDGTKVLTLPAGLIDASAGAVVLNVTATNTVGPGFVTVWPAGKAQPTASSLNIERAGQTIANLVTVGLGTNETIAFYAKSSADLVADLAGYFLPTAATSAGRFQPVTPTRLLDTRDTGGPFGAGDQRTVTVAGAAGVPAHGAAAVMLNVTATDTAGSGYVTVWPAGITRPIASNVNFDVANQTIPNQVVVSLPPSGALAIYSHQRADVIVDVVGWYTDATAASGVVGLFFPIGPLRLLDTRDTGPAPGRDVTATVDATAAHVSLDAIGITANVTAVDARAPGYVTAWSGSGPRPLASNLNVDRVGQTIPNQVTSPLANGSFSIYTQNGADLVVDVTGFYRGLDTTAFAAR